jgi:2-oxoglutarate ferredoxin oxidoreductase subunit beta
MLINELEIPPAKLRVLHFDGTPITARFITQYITDHVHEARSPQRPHDLHRQAAPAPPSLTPNKVGYTRRDYEGKVSTLCAGCGHDSISAAIIQACWELDIEPHRVAKLSGIGCSSKTPDYFLGASHGFNTVHGRMPSVLTGANLANRDLLYLGVSGDGDSASIGLGQFAHAMRRGVNMVYIVENNGVYGLTKGQFSATADKGSKSKKGAVNADSPVDLVGLAMQLGASFVARSFSGDKAQLVPLIKAAGPRRRGLHRRHQPLRHLQQPRRQHAQLRLGARAQRGRQPHRLHPGPPGNHGGLRARRGDRRRAARRQHAAPAQAAPGLRPHRPRGRHGLHAGPRGQGRAGHGPVVPGGRGGRPARRPAHQRAALNSLGTADLCPGAAALEQLNAGWR